MHLQKNKQRGFLDVWEMDGNPSTMETYQQLTKFKNLININK